ncbi:MAG: hypothetical protein ACXVZV_16250, partial [Terriglobales bacterium]
MVRRIAVLPLLLTLCSWFALAADKPQTGFLDRSITVEGKMRKYVVYVPSNWTPAEKWPVILFLHGAGERGSDGLKESQVGLPSA